jgi:FlaA1/EpsC-like NDP-sugar epimerase
MKNKLYSNKNINFKNNIVLIAGAGGTIGSTIVNRIEAKQIIAIDISEYAIYKLQRSNNSKNIKFIVGDISDLKFVNMIFNKYKIDYVFNAAAYKHVDKLQEDDNTYSVIKNNILSVLNLCEHIDKIKTLIHISSDKAVNPINNMGYTKLWCERIVQQYDNCKIVRFGNVYGSSGSFIETLKWQLENELPITITDKNMKRYFMTVDDAVSLILDISGVEYTNATYILDMGKEIPIVDIVNELNYNNNPITYIGIRSGEKLNEELVCDYEVIENTIHPMIKRVGWKCIDMKNNINILLKELGKNKICLPTLNKIITTTTIL